MAGLLSNPYRTALQMTDEEVPYVPPPSSPPTDPQASQLLGFANPNDWKNLQNYSDSLPAPQQDLHGGILPVSRDASGLHFDYNTGLLGSTIRSLALPGDVATGKVDPASPEGMDRAFEMAGNLGLGGFAMPKPANTLGAFGGKLLSSEDGSWLKSFADSMGAGVTSADKPKGPFGLSPSEFKAAIKGPAYTVASEGALHPEMVNKLNDITGKFSKATDNYKQAAQAVLDGSFDSAKSTFENNPDILKHVYSLESMNKIISNKPTTAVAPAQWSPKLDNILSADKMIFKDDPDMAKIVDDMYNKGPNGFNYAKDKYGADPAVKAYIEGIEKLHNADANPIKWQFADPPAKPRVDPSELLSKHVMPIDWQTYTPPRGAQGLATPPPNMSRAQELGYNTGVPLFKGMEVRMDKDAFWDPSSKPNEKAIFAADNPKIANSYANSGMDSHNLVPMFARAEKPFAVNWPDIAPSKSYNGTVMRDLINHVRGQGGDMLAIHNIHDLGGDQTQYAIMDPTKLRVRHAAFNPANLGSDNLLSATGVPGMPLLYQGGQQ